MSTQTVNILALVLGAISVMIAGFAVFVQFYISKMTNLLIKEEDARAKELIREIEKSIDEGNRRHEEFMKEMQRMIEEGNKRLERFIEETQKLMVEGMKELRKV